MKNKMLRRIGAGVTAACVLGSMSMASAEVAITSATYNAANNELTINYTGAATTGYNTFLVYNPSGPLFKTASLDNGVLSDEVATPYATGNAIAYVDQTEAGAAEGFATFKLLDDVKKGIADGTINKLAVGMGGTDIETPSLKMIQLKKEISAIASAEEADKNNDGELTVLAGTKTKDDILGILPSKVKATVEYGDGEEEVQLPITGWTKQGTGGELTNEDLNTATVITLQATVGGLDDYVYAESLLSPNEALEFTLTVVDTVTVTTLTPTTTAVELSLGSQEADALPELQKEKFKITAADPEIAENLEVTFANWTLSGSWNATGTNTYTAVGDSAKVDGNEHLTVTVAAPPTATVTVTQKTAVTISSLKYSKEVTGTVTVPYGTTLATLTELENSDIPEELIIDQFAPEAPDSTIPTTVKWTINSWKISGEGDGLVENAEVAVVPATYSITGELTDEKYIFKLADNVTIPTITVKVAPAAPEFTYGDLNGKDGIDPNDVSYVYSMAMGGLTASNLSDYSDEIPYDWATLQEIANVYRGALDPENFIDPQDVTYVYSACMGAQFTFPEEE